MTYFVLAFLLTALWSAAFVAVWVLSGGGDKRECAHFNTHHVETYADVLYDVLYDVFMCENCGEELYASKAGGPYMSRYELQAKRAADCSGWV